MNKIISPEILKQAMSAVSFAAEPPGPADTETQGYKLVAEHFEKSVDELKKANVENKKHTIGDRLLDIDFITHKATNELLGVVVKGRKDKDSPFKATVISNNSKYTLIIDGKAGGGVYAIPNHKKIKNEDKVSIDNSTLDVNISSVTISSPENLKGGPYPFVLNGVPGDESRNRKEEAVLKTNGNVLLDLTRSNPEKIRRLSLFLVNLATTRK